jgi:hypothetical protein
VFRLPATRRQLGEGCEHGPPDGVLFVLAIASLGKEIGEPLAVKSRRSDEGRWPAAQLGSG